MILTAARWMLRLWTRAAAEIMSAVFVGGWGCYVLIRGPAIVDDQPAYALLREIWGLQHWAHTLAVWGRDPALCRGPGCRLTRGFVAFWMGWFSWAMATTIHTATPDVTIWWFFQVNAVVGYGTVAVFVALWLARHRGWNVQ